MKIATPFLETGPQGLEQMPSLRLRDHGGEIFAGLCELYVTLHYVDAESAQKYKSRLKQLIDKILGIGTNKDGLLYDEINPLAGVVTKSSLADTWGYIYNGIYSLYLIDENPRYRQAVQKVLRNSTQHTESTTGTIPRLMEKPMPLKALCIYIIENQ
ncbi:MAG: hypothetical protein IT292_06725 [Deltaproteobacteria bacterium]|nr:hypothetical protein [Deltaproteobacteria bacterium]